MIETNLLTFIWNIIDLILYLEIVRSVQRTSSILC